VLLLTLGETCRYAVQADDGSLVLSDPGASIHIPALLQRLERLTLDPSAINRVILTHLDPDRIAGLALLRRCAPKLQVVGSAQMADQMRDAKFVEALWSHDRLLLEAAPQHLEPKCDLDLSEFKESLRIDQILSDGASIQLDAELTLYCIWTPGHTELSLSYYLAPFGFAIVDETFGYYRYREVPALGADYKLQKAISSIAKLSTRQLTGLGLPYRGALTGALAHSYLHALEQALRDLTNEFKAARKRGLSRDDILRELKGSIYCYSGADPLLARSLDRSLTAIISQL